MAIQPTGENIMHFSAQMSRNGGVRHQHERNGPYTLNHIVAAGLASFRTVASDENLQSKRAQFTEWRPHITTLEKRGREAQEEKVCNIWARFLSFIGRFCCKGHFYYNRDTEMAKVQKKLFTPTPTDIAVFNTSRGKGQFGAVVRWLEQQPDQGSANGSTTVPWNLVQEVYTCAAFLITVEEKTRDAIAITHGNRSLIIQMDNGLHLAFWNSDGILHKVDEQKVANVSILAPYARCYEELIRLASAAQPSV